MVEAWYWGQYLHLETTRGSEGSSCVCNGISTLSSKKAPIYISKGILEPCLPHRV